MKHPLINRYLVWDASDRSYWTLSKFIERLDDGVFLMEQYQPASGERAIGGNFILHLASLIVDADSADPDERTLPYAQIFNDYAAVQSYIDEMNKSDTPKVVQLVKK